MPDKLKQVLMCYENRALVLSIINELASRPDIDAVIATVRALFFCFVWIFVSADDFSAAALGKRIPRPAAAPGDCAGARDGRRRRHRCYWNAPARRAALGEVHHGKRT